MPKQPNADRTIDAMPTKELFIAMLTRDVALIPAIIDLADNCTDGARRVKGNKSWSGMDVRIEAKSDKFTISDNCGGMDVDTAQNTAFRFGREAGFVPDKGEVGRFGVGMKRGLFKMGRHFHIRSTTKKTQFDVTIDVDKWAKDNVWKFKFDRPPVENGNFAAADHGTTLTVTKLHAQVAEHFNDDQFIQELREQLTSRLETSLAKGLSVTVNGISLKAHARTLVAGKGFTPARKKFAVKGNSGKPVTVELLCGVGHASSGNFARAESGWYVFCNGRMLLEANKEKETGWGVEDDESIPAYHPQFNDFRGYAYLDADDAADLPWNTTKTALDTDHPVYRRVRQEMVLLARPVIDFLNKRKQEVEARNKAGETEKGHLESLFAKANSKPLTAFKGNTVFSSPPAAKTPKSKASDSEQVITFRVERDKADAVKNSLEATSWAKVGEEVFNYYYNAECDDE